MANATINPFPYVEMGDRLREAREKLGLSQTALADKIASLPNSSRKTSNRNTISRFETGQYPISREYAALFSQVLGVRAEWLLGEDDFPTESEKSANAFISFKNELDRRNIAFMIFSALAGYNISLFQNGENEKDAETAINAIKRGYTIIRDGEIVGYIPLEKFNLMSYAIQEQTELYINQYLREVSDNGSHK